MSSNSSPSGAAAAFRHRGRFAVVLVASLLLAVAQPLFSFITLATVGYGDVTPATPLARTLAWTEAVTGQLYLAILVAGLVGFKVTQATKQ